MSAPMFVENVIPAACAWLAQGARVALITLVGADGSSPRPLGSQMAVREDGVAVGLISGGCVEAALTHEAVAALADGRNRKLRYGKDSPFFDIRLPCGSGIDVLIDVNVGADVLFAVRDQQLQRQPALLCMDLERAASGDGAYLQLEACSGMQASDSYANGDRFVRVYNPATRLLAFGRGEIFRQLLMLTPAMGYEVLAVSPGDASGYAPPGVTRLHTPDHFEEGWSDAWTAAALLFHDHEWELPILRNLLRTDCFYIGALGSLRTQALRREQLATEGVSATEVDRVKGPIGLNIGGKTPPEIAISILAEIISRRA
ncbi:XdhC family protein [Hahella sp. CR1]|uniref:XdhC family protein n=1 Tax=Hahella sp. CR1 TaxID=2992807 RepID=UPI002442EACE|nr:XdhC family protein [Hahella sp. CR1]MDG9669719.1 XdhC family protein [Hahella sp. CR1]